MLSKYGKYFYENLIIFAPTVQEFGGSLSVETITQFIDDGGNIFFVNWLILLILTTKMYIYDFVGNVLFTGGASTGSALRELAAECGFEVTEENSSLIDHLNYDASDSGKVKKKTFLYDT